MLLFNAIKYNSGNPIFMDVDEFFNIDENKTIEFILNNTYQNYNIEYQDFHIDTNQLLLH